MPAVTSSSSGPRSGAMCGYEECLFDLWRIDLCRLDDAYSARVSCCDLGTLTRSGKANPSPGLPLRVIPRTLLSNTRSPWPTGERIKFALSFFSERVQVGESWLKRRGVQAHHEVIDSSNLGLIGVSSSICRIPKTSLKESSSLVRTPCSGNPANGERRSMRTQWSPGYGNVLTGVISLFTSSLARFRPPSTFRPTIRKN